MKTIMTSAFRPGTALQHLGSCRSRCEYWSEAINAVLLASKRSPSTTPEEPPPARLWSAKRPSLHSRRPRIHTSSASRRLIARAYHSSDHPTSEPTDAFSPTQQEILRAAYARVPEHGFSQDSLTLGAQDAGLLGISTNLLPSREFSLIQWHLLTQRAALADVAREFWASTSEAESRVVGLGKRVELLTWARLQGNVNIVHHWQQALAIMAQPAHAPEAVKELARLADEIWYLAGDISMDTSWYTKRASLSAVYASTELFMTTDKSDGFQETRDFLQRRLAGAQETGGIIRDVGQWAAFTASASINALRSKGVRI